MASLEQIVRSQLAYERMESRNCCAETNSQSFHSVMLFAAENSSNIAAMLPFLSNYCITLTLTTLEENPTIRKEDGYFFYTEDFKYVSDPMEAIKGIRENYPEDYIVITGSKDFVREMRKRIAD